MIGTGAFPAISDCLGSVNQHLAAARRHQEGYVAVQFDWLDGVFK
jgi:hypothetical protein